MAQVNFRIEDNLKTEADYIFSRIGMTMSSALNIFIRQVVDRRGIPFEIRLSDPSLTSREQVLQAARDYADGKKNYTYHELPPMDFDDASLSCTNSRSRREKALV